jgi:hypothetical protein
MPGVPVCESRPDTTETWSRATVNDGANGQMRSFGPSGRLLISFELANKGNQALRDIGAGIDG